MEVREQLAFDDSSLEEALRGLKLQNGFSEAFILSTCNRVEVAVTTDEQADPQSSLLDFLCRSRRVDPHSIGPHLYRHEDRAAIRHIFRVAASLDSMVVGEPQILGQMKTAFALAKAHGAAGGFLDSVLTRAFSVAKRVRSETEIGRSAVSVSFVAVELAREIFGSLAGKKVLIVGAGKMSELAARHLHRSGADQIFVTNRTHDRAVEMAVLFQGSVVEYDQFLAGCPEIDILIASSGAPHYILHKEHVRHALEVRRNRPMFLIDIAVPRNIDPAVNTVDNAFCTTSTIFRRSPTPTARGGSSTPNKPSRSSTRKSNVWSCGSRRAKWPPRLCDCRANWSRCARARWIGCAPGSGPLTPEQEDAVEALTRGIIAKIAHAPIAELRKQAAEPNGLPAIELIRRIFRLDE